MITFWIVLSGYYDLFHISLGVISVVFVLWFNAKLRNYVFYDEDEAHKSQNFKLYRLFYYLHFLVWEIISSSFKVAYLIIHPKMPIKAGIIKFHTKLPNMTAKVLLANSITLTPGTVAIQIEGDEFIIHSLTNEKDEAHIDHTLTEEVAKLYGISEENVVYCEEIISSGEQM
jgi:multicomponent Na+:H+ antiporter subunit E